MNRLILNPLAYSFTAIAVLPKQDRSDGVKPFADGSYPQKTNVAGELQWLVQCLVQTSDGKPETCEVTITGAEPKLAALTPIEFGNLVGSPWLNNGRAGVAFRADSVRAKAAKNNGVKADPVAAGSPV